MHEHAEQQPLRVHRDVALAPVDQLRRIVAARSPAFPRKSLRDFAVVFTLCVSMMAAVGLASRPTPSRSMTTRWWRMVSHVPALRNTRM